MTKVTKLRLPWYIATIISGIGLFILAALPTILAIAQRCNMMGFENIKNEFLKASDPLGNWYSYLQKQSFYLSSQKEGVLYRIRISCAPFAMFNDPHGTSVFGLFLSIPTYLLNDMRISTSMLSGKIMFPFPIVAEHPTLFRVLFWISYVTNFICMGHNIIFLLHGKNQRGILGLMIPFGLFQTILLPYLIAAAFVKWVIFLAKKKCLPYLFAILSFVGVIICAIITGIGYGNEDINIFLLLLFITSYIIFAIISTVIINHTPKFNGMDIVAIIFCIPFFIIAILFIALLKNIKEWLENPDTSKPKKKDTISVFDNGFDRELTHKGFGLDYSIDNPAERGVDFYEDDLGREWTSSDGINFTKKG